MVESTICFESNDYINNKSVEGVFVRTNMSYNYIINLQNGLSNPNGFRRIRDTIQRIAPSFD